jgi:hypothetical protein
MRQQWNVSRMRSAFLQELPQVLNHIFPVLPMGELMVPDTFDQNVARRQERVSCEVSLLLFRMPVAEAVEFNRELGFETKEVEIVRPLAMLATKLVSGQST